MTGVTASASPPPSLSLFFPLSHFLTLPLSLPFSLPPSLSPSLPQDAELRIGCLPFSSPPNQPLLHPCQPCFACKYPFFSSPLFLWHLAVLLWLTSWRVCSHTHISEGWRSERDRFQWADLYSVMWHACAQGFLGTVDCPAASPGCLCWMED